MKPAKTMPAEASEPMVKHAAKKGARNSAGPGMQQASASGTQKSLNKAKNQSKTLRYLR